MTKTRRYEFSHGRSPRGKGNWAFDIEHRIEKADGWVTDTRTAFAPRPMTITEAKACVRNTLRGDRSVIEVQMAP